ncbi:MAG: hypothetical protein JSV62_06580 [Promethearchaeota archaeon]|nr:MAG: hypothetical protein JSV62_06580 [Candidatus Lokiarchaeota archaeon]
MRCIVCGAEIKLNKVSGMCSNCIEDIKNWKVRGYWDNYKSRIDIIKKS